MKWRGFLRCTVSLPQNPHRNYSQRGSCVDEVTKQTIESVMLTQEASSFPAECPARHSACQEAQSRQARLCWEPYVVLRLFVNLLSVTHASHLYNFDGIFYCKNDSVIAGAKSPKLFFGTL